MASGIMPPLLVKFDYKSCVLVQLNQATPVWYSACHCDCMSVCAWWHTVSIYLVSMLFKEQLCNDSYRRHACIIWWNTNSYKLLTSINWSIIGKTLEHNR